MAFGQHQTFYLRLQWLSKGLKEVHKNSRFFYENDHFEHLGVGKNMAKSIRHWLIATGLVKENRSTYVEHVFTPFGELVFKKDPYIQSPVTLSLLHYFLVTNESLATTWYWFFNVYTERIFTKKLLIDDLTKWVEQNFEKQVSETSIKRDIDCLIQLYTKKQYKKMTPEDVIKSPLEELGLLKQSTSVNYLKSEIENEELIKILYLTLLLYAEKHNVNELSINDLVNAPELFGKVFNLNRVSIIESVEKLSTDFPVSFVQTNRLNIVRLDLTQNFLEALEQYYDKSEVQE